MICTKPRKLHNDTCRENNTLTDISMDTRISAVELYRWEGGREMTVGGQQSADDLGKSPVSQFVSK